MNGFGIDDKSKNFVHNGQLGFDHIGYSYVLNELVQEYSNHNKERHIMKIFISTLLITFRI